MKTFTSFLLLCFCLTSISSWGQTPFLEPDLDPGPYKVGFKVFHEYDYSRTYSMIMPEEGDREIAGGFRPIQICVWYPVSPSKKGNLMPYRKYVELVATELDFDYKGAPLEHPKIQEGYFNNAFFSKEQLELALKSRSGAIQDATIADGKFPVLAYSPGGAGSSFENSTLFEYLASHGFISAATPSIKGSDGYGSKPTIPIFEFPSRDLEFVIGFMHQFPGANLDQLGILGFSLGGAAIINVASRHLKVKAVASLDGWHNESNSPLLPFVDLERLHFPFLSIHGKRGKHPGIIYNNIRNADVYDILLKKFGHVFYGSSWILLSDHQADDRNAIKASQEDINLGYRILCQYVRHFFQAYLLGDEQSKQKLKTLDQQSGVRKDFLEIQWK